ncbi:MAG: hypothetical protein Q7S09_05935 [bacterium]|nr:hypothetical protein [bacterium]
MAKKKIIFWIEGMMLTLAFILITAFFARAAFALTPARTVCQPGQSPETDWCENFPAPSLPENCVGADTYYNRKTNDCGPIPDAMARPTFRKEGPISISQISALIVFISSALYVWRRNIPKNKKWLVWKIILIGFPILFVPLYLYFTIYDTARAYTVCGGCRVEYKDLGIGMESNPKDGTARLWLFVRGKSEEDKVVTVHASETVTIDKYQIKVFDITGGNGSIRLLIREGNN